MNVLTLPATAAEARTAVLVPALAELSTRMCTPRAQVQLLAMAQQESGLRTRVQHGGPARGLWQMELGAGPHAGVRGVVAHPRSGPLLKIYCIDHDLAFDAEAIYRELEGDDELACVAARLLLYTLPEPLAAINDADAGWRQYLAAWRPGKPRPETWAAYHAAAVAALP